MSPPRLADACPSCHPGDYPAVTRRSVTPDANNSLCAEYTHTAGGVTHSWATWWNADAADVFPLQRTGTAPEPSVVTPAAWREAKLRAKARLQVEESRRGRGAGERWAS